jgi:tetratricopeptide (TPR) repeat protein
MRLPGKELVPDPEASIGTGPGRRKSASPKVLDLHAARGIFGRVSEVQMNKRVLSACLMAAIALGLTAPLSAGDARSEAKAQVEFGIEVAQKKLWREAVYRFEKAVETDPTYPAAWNNLAIAYEQAGNFNDANKAYSKAVELDPGNLLIRQNYDLFKEIYDRISRRNRR